MKTKRMNSFFFFLHISVEQKILIAVYCYEPKRKLSVSSALFQAKELESLILESKSTENKVNILPLLCFSAFVKKFVRF